MRTLAAIQVQEGCDYDEAVAVQEVEECKSELPSSTGSAVQELFFAAHDLIQKGGSVVRRNALRHALEAVELSKEITEQVERQQTRFTPAVKWVLCRATKLASARRDEWIRTEHLEAALRELPNSLAVQT